MSYWTTFVKKTRKRKRCEWCHQIIEKGASCFSVAGVWEDFYHYRSHPECYHAENEWWKDKCGEEAPDEAMRRGMPISFEEEVTETTLKFEPTEERRPLAKPQS